MPDLLGRLIVGALALACAVYFAIGYVQNARAHEAVTGFVYPARCCSGHDCSHAISATRNPDGSLTVTTKHGTATFPATFEHEPSPDGLIHACFSPWRLCCLFLNTGS